MRPAWLVAGALLTALGVAWAPRDLAPPRFTPEQALPTLGRQVTSFEVRRWVRVEVPNGMRLEEFLRRYHLTARTFVCRRECRGPDLKQAECAGLSGALWVAAGSPEPREGPACGGTP